VHRLFTAHSFESDFPLMTNIEGKEGKNIKMPDGIRYTCYSVCLTGVVSVCVGGGGVLTVGRAIYRGRQKTVSP